MTAARAADIKMERDGETYTDSAHIVAVHMERENTHTNVRCTSRFWSRTPPLGTPSQFLPHPHTNTHTGWFPCTRGGARTNQHAGNGRSMKTSGVATLPNALPGVAAPIPREGLLMGFFPLVCMRVSLVRCATGFARVLHPNCTATEHERYTLHATFSHLRLQHYVEPLDHPDSTLDSTDWYLPAALAHVRRSSFNIHRKDRCWMQRANLENLGNGRRERLRLYSRKGDLRYFLGDEISKMKSSCLVEEFLHHVYRSFRELCS